MIDLDVVESVSDTWLELSSRRPGPIAQLCHLLSVVPQGVCKVSVIFVRVPLTDENANDKYTETPGDGPDLFTSVCSDPDHAA